MLGCATEGKQSTMGGTALSKDLRDEVVARQTSGDGFQKSKGFIDPKEHEVWHSERDVSGISRTLPGSGGPSSLDGK